MVTAISMADMEEIMEKSIVSKDEKSVKRRKNGQE